jgi:hypothetical protein
VTLSNPNIAGGPGTGAVLLSANGGTSFAPVTVNGAEAAESDWCAVTMSSDATRLAAAAGRFETNGKGRIFLSTGARPQ